MSLVNAVKQTLLPGLGASQAAAALGVSPWESPIKLWLKLTGRVKASGDEYQSDEARWGQILEPVVRGYYAERNGYTGEHSRIVVPTESMFHPELPWLRATPDGMVQEDYPPGLGEGSFYTHLLEVKCPSWRTSWHWGHPKFRTVPPHYRIQAVVGMAVTGLPRTAFAVLIGGSDYCTPTPIERDPELEDITLEQLAKFWHLVQTDTPPEVDDAKEWRDYFADRLPRERVEIKAGPDIEAVMDEWFDAYRAHEKAVKDLDRVRNIVLACAVEHQATCINTDHGRVSVRRSQTGTPYIVTPESFGVEE